MDQKNKRSNLYYSQEEFSYNCFEYSKMEGHNGRKNNSY